MLSIKYIISYISLTVLFTLLIFSGLSGELIILDEAAVKKKQQTNPLRERRNNDKDNTFGHDLFLSPDFYCTSSTHRGRLVLKI